jgi:hypothetical protein
MNSVSMLFASDLWSTRGWPLPRRFRGYGARNRQGRGRAGARRPGPCLFVRAREASRRVHSPGVRRCAGVTHTSPLKGFEGVEHGIRQGAVDLTVALYHIAAVYGVSSRMRLTGVCAARRRLVNPASRATLRSRSSPACAPRPSPTSCDNECGVQAMADAA